MRNLLLLLLLANALYFLWEQFIVKDNEQGIAIVREADLGPPLALAEDVLHEAPAEAMPESSQDTTATDPNEMDDTADIQGEAEDAPPPVSQSKDLQALVGRSCVSIGPFRESEEADAAQAEYAADGMNAALRTTKGQVFIGHWVQIRNIADRATANEMLKELNKGGLGEAYMFPTDDGGINISIGLFGDMRGAERTELQAKSMGLPADVSPRTRDATVFYVDIGLPPGKGAGAIVEQYGEERVLMREAATCPKAG